MSISVEMHLQEFRALHGDEAWQAEVRRLAKDGIRVGPRHETFWREFTKDFNWLDWDALKKEASSEATPVDTERWMSEMLRQQMPGIKTQAQYNAVVGALDAVRMVLTHILNQDRKLETDSRAVLETSFEATRFATELTHKLEEVPEAATSQAAEQFKAPPVEFQEVEILGAILSELHKLQTIEALDTWYAGTKAKRDRVVTQILRNKMLDAIRAAKIRLQKG